MTDVAVVEQAEDIALLDEARHAIEKATTVAEITDIIGKAEAMRIYLKRVDHAHMLVEYALQIKLRAERKGGELLPALISHGGGEEARSCTATLPDLGITKNQSANWQRIASIPDETFEEALAEAKSETEMLRLARSLQKPPESPVPPSEPPGDPEPPEAPEPPTESLHGVWLDQLALQHAAQRLAQERGMDWYEGMTKEQRQDVLRETAIVLRAYLRKAGRTSP